MPRSLAGDLLQRLLGVGYQLGFESLSILLFAVFIEIVWVDLCAT